MLFFIALHSTAQISVDTGFTATQLAQKLVGKGLTVFNARLVAVPNQCGVFKATPNVLPIDSGVVLSNGYVKSNQLTGVRGIQSCNNCLIVGTFSTTGDTSINKILNTNTDITKDACILEFDFIPTGDSINFNYFFSSDEYGCCTCTKYNDAFAFFIKGLGYSTETNIALVPNTSVPVAINSINNGVPSTFYPSNIAWCNALGTGSPFTQYYISHNQISSFFSQYACTRKLTAKAKVVPCTVYHIKLVIADVGDAGVDSGVFLEAGSFSSPKAASVVAAETYTVNGVATLVERCKPQGKIKIVRSTANNAQPFNIGLNYGGTATYGIDYNALDTVVSFAANQDTVTLNINIADDGTGDDNENIIVKLLQQGNCTSGANVIDSIIINIKESWHTYNKADSIVCKNVGKPFTSSKASVANTTFIWSNGNTTASNTIAASGIYWVNAIQNTTCIHTDSFTVSKDSFTIVTIPQQDSICKENTKQITYTTNEPISSKQWNTGSTDSIITATQQGNYILTAQNNLGCISKDTSAIKYKLQPLLQLPATVSCCVGDSVLLNVASSQIAVYSWNTGSNTSSIYVSTPNTYTVNVTGNNGCKNADTTVLSLYTKPTVTTGADKQIIKGNSILLDATCSNNVTQYLWQPNYNLNNAAILQPTALVDKDITYTITVYTANNCFATDSINIKAIDKDIVIPNVFSPNGDGINDVWEIPSLLAYPQAKTLVFDRYGRKVFESLGYKKPWNGNYFNTGNALAVGSYYYIISTNDSKPRTISGSITILR